MLHASRHSKNSLYTDNSDDSDQLPLTVPVIAKQQIPKTLIHPPPQAPKAQGVLIHPPPHPPKPQEKKKEKEQKAKNTFSSNYIDDMEERAGVYNALINNEQSTPKKPVLSHKAENLFRIHQSVEKPHTKSTKRYSIDVEEDKVYKPREYMSFAAERQNNSQKMNHQSMRQDHINYQSMRQGRMNYQSMRQDQQDSSNQEYRAQEENKYWEKGHIIQSKFISQQHNHINQVRIKGTNERDTKTCKHLVRHFHKHGTFMNNALNKYMEIFEQYEQKVTNEVYKISLFDNLAVIKLKMEAYLQSKIDLANLSAQRPTAQWSQQELTNFYLNYRPLLRKPMQQNEGERIPLTLKKYKNCVYFGKIIDNKKEGEGILHYFTGKFFQGAFSDDHKSHGLEIDDQELYIGSFNKGIRQGQGILKTHDSLSVGTFKNGSFSPTPATFQINHSRIRFNTSPNACIFKNNNSDIYIGGTSPNEEKEDEGLEIFSNGDIYIGRYEAGSPQGYGEYYWETGAFYRGQFLSGMRHGRGIWEMLHGDHYEGEYMNDKKNGEGTYVWKNGSKYTGHFENDYRHGYGQMVWQDGRTYKGMWLNGIQKNTLIKLQDRGQSRSNRNTSTSNKNRHTLQSRGSINSRTVNRKLGQMNTLEPQGFRQRNIPMSKLHALFNPASNLM